MIKKVKRTIYIPEKLRDDLLEIADNKGISQNSLIILMLQDQVKKELQNNN